MSSIINALIEYSSKKPCLVNYQGKNNELTIPFNFTKQEDTVIKGINFITNEDVILESKNILGYTWWSDDQQDHFEKRCTGLKNKINHINKLFEEYKFIYSFDKMNLYYIDDPRSVVLLPFDLETVNDLLDENKINECKTKFIKILALTSERAKSNIKSQSEAYLNDNEQDSGAAEEVQAIIEIIDESVKEAKLDFDTPYQLISEGWPPLLSPNPFAIEL